jgi:hypothetical protein
MRGNCNQKECRKSLGCASSTEKYGIFFLSVIHPDCAVDQVYVFPKINGVV